MKKIINQPMSLVVEMCHGMALAHPQLVFFEKYKFLARKQLNPNKVTLISGGGSGHEPAHGGYVGKGMLDAAVCGDVFASPSQVQVYHAIKETCGKNGALLIVKNYSGDIMNFKNAAYMAQEDGFLVDYVKVDDDIAVQDSLYTIGRRGVAGTVFVHKIAGAAAERGFDLSRVKEIAERTIQNVKSIGFAETSCTVPANGAPTFELGEDEIEYGVGIHGEPGVKREKMASSDVLAEKMVEQLLFALQTHENDEVAVLINGLGGTPVQELYVLNHSVRRVLAQRKIQVALDLVGNYMTSIDMEGSSVTLLKLDPELKELLFDPCDTVGMKFSGSPDATDYFELQEIVTNAKEFSACEAFTVTENNHLSLDNIIYLVKAMSECVIRNEAFFCELDSHAGDGDFGTSIARGFRKLQEEWNSVMESAGTIGNFLNACSLVIMEYCGGASGPIWGSAFRAAGRAAQGKTSLSATEFSQLLQSAVHGIQIIGERSFGRGAVIGDKTLIDALIPCADRWSELSESSSVKTLFVEGAKAAVNGAKKTERIVARMGRAGTVGERSIGYPDAGAYALGVIFTDLAGRIC